MPRKASPEPVGFSASTLKNPSLDCPRAVKSDRAAFAHLVDDERVVLFSKVLRQFPAGIDAAGKRSEFLVIANNQVAHLRGFQSDCAGIGRARPGIGPVVEIEDHGQAVCLCLVKGHESRRPGWFGGKTCARGNQGAVVGKVDPFYVVAIHLEIGGAVSVDHVLAVFTARFDDGEGCAALSRDGAHMARINSVVGELVEDVSPDRIVGNGSDECRPAALARDRRGNIGGRSAQRR